MIQKQPGCTRIFRDDRGMTVFVLVALLAVSMVIAAALAVDIGHLYVVKNELQNAADAAALAGASVLYDPSGESVNANANQTAYNTAIANVSGSTPVVVNAGDIQRGHYNPVSADFTVNESSLTPVPLNRSDGDLNADTNFINAIRVVTRTTSSPSFFGRVIGRFGFSLTAEATAYIGFAGTLQPREVEEPMAICEGALLIGGFYSCPDALNPYARVFPEPSQSGSWTDFVQSSDPLNSPCTPCAAGAGDPTTLISCAATLTGNPNQMLYGYPVALNSGSYVDTLRSQWRMNCAMNDLDNDGTRESPIDSDGNGTPDRPWELTLPVVDCASIPFGCPGGGTTCAALKGAVTVKVIWITDDQVCDNAPSIMYSEPSGAGPRDWTFTGPIAGCEGHCLDPTSGECRWCSFARHFQIQDSSGTIGDDCSYGSLQNILVFEPDCQVHKPVGNTGGRNFGVLAKYPVLVK